MADFSNIPDLLFRPRLVALMQARGELITDEILAEILKRIDPPLLDPREGSTVTAILERRRGRRPARGVPSLPWLARQVSRIERPDVHPAFLAALSDRIRNGKGRTDRERELRHFRECRRRDRDMFIRTVFRDLKVALEAKPDRISLEHFGEIEVPPGMPPQMQAATMTLHILSEKLGIDRISHSRIIRIATMRHYIEPVCARAEAEKLP